jgi:hypothetical protein
MTKMIQIEASTQREFHAVVSDAGEAVTGAGGWIVSHQFFSNTLAMIAFRIQGSSLSRLYEALREHGVTVHQELPATEAGEISAQLSITFLRTSGDVRRAVPAFS